MAKTKNKNKSEVEYLWGVIRKLRAKLKQYEKEPPKEQEPDCVHCGKGMYRMVDLYRVRFKVCDICGYKEKI